MFLFKRKNGFYYVYYNDGTQRKSKTTKCKDKRGATEFLRSFIKEDIKPVNPVMYLESLEGEVIKYVTDNLTKGTLITYISTFKLLKEIIGNKPIKMYSARDIENYKAVRIQKVAKTTCNIELRVMKAIFNLAIKWSLLDKNPLKDVKQFQLPEKKPLAFTKEQTDLILESIESPVIKDIVRFSLLTGCRINETLNVQYKDIDFIESVLTIGNKQDFRTKSGKVRYIPINEALRILLERITAPTSNVIDIDGYLFNRRGFKFNSDYVSKCFKRALRKAGFNEMYHFHHLRSTCITNLVRAGGNIRFVQAIAGHSSLSMTELYLTLSVNDLKKTMALLN